MGSNIKINDTLQITREQGFPAELNFEKHLAAPLNVEDFAGQIFEFKDKPGIREYQQPPVRNFLVENRDGKWLYWGLIHVLEVRHDYLRQTTSGKFKIMHIYGPDDMKKAHELIDRNEATNLFV